MFVETKQYKKVKIQFKVNYKLIPDSREVEIIKKEGESYWWCSHYRCACWKRR